MLTILISITLSSFKFSLLKYKPVDFLGGWSSILRGCAERTKEQKLGTAGVLNRASSGSELFTIRLSLHTSAFTHPFPPH